ncbi:Serine/threonine-protein kinase PrkC [Aquisphaera giovannonii]|uniref:Serine/threonine-protein kinase PrkC n=1 Tax=Aquisphaera giovannonii TaxID=406548 RepID=A0A5B9WF55_9BACT|nr:serine/threonine-protein kinase [Aquisphaera giovannonii]QEH38695.1 Serine/threonine-protein kinase PrkC [Aquisphaera giovannonii]
MLEPQTSRFWQASLQSGLLDAAGLAACWEGIPPEKRDAPEHLDRRLARQAIHRGLLSLWQAQQLLAGRTSGFRVDRYVLVDLIGQGGMGRVYLARDSRLNRQVALKILSPERMNNPRAIARFQREARVGAQLQHENLVRIYDFGESNGRFFLVMEYIEGKTIGGLIAAQGPMPPITAARLVRQIALGLEHAHRKDLIHRDVNPYNVMVTHDGVAKLADLGLAINKAEDERVTRDGATVGTFDYVAPEQARHSHSADIRSDIYSLGCTFYHMIAGQVPFPSPSLPEKLFAHQALEPAPLSRFAPDIPQALAEVVRRMMRKSPDDRFGTPLQVAQAIDACLEAHDRAAASRAGAGDDPEIATGVLMPGDPDSPTSTPGMPPSRTPIPEPASPARFAGAGVAATPAAAYDAAGPPPMPSAGASGPESAVATATPVPASDQPVGSEEEIPLYLDLGPEPSLSESIARPRPWFSGERSASSSGLQPAAPVAAAAPGTLAARLRGRWPWAAALLAAIALAIAASIVSRRAGGTAKATSSPASKQPAADAPRDGRAKEAGAGTAPAQPTSPIAVLDPDGGESPAKDLYQAMEAAVGVKGSVVLRNREPLVVSVPDAPRVMASTGWLKLKAAPGTTPVLVAELKGKQPLLVTGAATNLVVEGLTIVARYPSSAPASPDGPPPLIRAAGAAEFRRCAFLTDRGPEVEGSRAIVAEGGQLVVEGGWFRGFRHGIEVNAIGGAKADLKQTMIVPAAGRPGSGVTVRFLGGGSGSGRTLSLDRFTFAAGEAPIRLSGFTPEAPLTVRAGDCAVQARGLVSWLPGTPAIPWEPRSLRWQGERNQYDIGGTAWVSQPGEGAAAVVLDREGWARLASEEHPIPGPIEFRTPAGRRPESPEPADFATGRRGDPGPGADPDQVGPTASSEIAN